MKSGLGNLSATTVDQPADLEKRAIARGWTVAYRLSDNDIGVTRKDPTTAGRHRPGYEEALRPVPSSCK